MSTFGNAIENWSVQSTGDIADLQHKLVSDGCTRSSPPIKAMASVVDSAYSSFSGSSYVTDYQAFQHGGCHLNDEQVSYMDSDYVKAIYNPSATDQKPFEQNLGCDNCSFKSYPSERIPKLSSSQVILNEDHLPLRKINYTTIQHFEQPDINREYALHFGHKTKRSPTGTSDFSSPEHKLGRHYVEDHSPTWVRDSMQGECNQSCVTSCNREKEDYSQFTSSSFLSSVGNLAKSHNVTCTGKENNSPSQVSVLNTDCLEQKDLQTTQQIRVKRKEQYPNNIFNYSDYCLSEGEAGKSTRRSLNELVSEKVEVRSGSWKSAQEDNCYNDEGTNSEGVEDLAHNQVCKEQYPPQSQYMKNLECDGVGQWDIKYKGLHTKNIQTLYSRPSEDLFEQPSKALNRDDLQKVSKTHVRKDATIKTIPLLSQEQEQTMPLTSNFCDLTSEKITKASTPMLYHLAGGKNSSLLMLNFKNQPKHLDANRESKTFQTTDNSTKAEEDEPQRPLHKIKSHSQLVDNSVDDRSECETSDNLTPSEESFEYDYREKLKVAQKKVLRETSFKRRDLQMSLPVRLKWDAPKRPSIDHVRSYSLSASNEEAKCVQPKTSVDNKKEPEKSIISRIGGRKRLTKEQRKLCYSEPEKLDHLGVHNSFSVWNNEGLNQTKLEEPHRMKSTDKEQTLSSSNLSKTELKQIQHNALVEYMERKATQRPSSVHQSQMQKPSGVKPLSEWKCLANEISNNDLPKTYYHRRSTGTSSSYDATVTWNDRLLKMSQGDPINSVDKAVDCKNKTYLDQSPLNNKKSYFEDPSATVSQKNSMSVNHSQVPAGHLTSSTSALSSSNHVCDNRPSVPMASTASEKVCPARGRGKSMEELGTSDRIRHSVLSQSSEQLHHIKGPALGPQSGSASSTAVVHQNKLKSNPEPGSQPRQTSTEDLLGPPRSDIAKLAHERHSRPQRASGASPGIDNSSSSLPIHFYPRTTDLSHSLQPDNEAFLQPNNITMDDVCSAPSISLEKTSPSCHPEEGLQAPSLLIHSHLRPQATSMHKASLEANEKKFPWCDNEMRTEVDDLCKNSALKEPSVSVTENPDSGAVHESETTHVQSIGILQQNNTDVGSSSLENGLKMPSSFIHGKNTVNDEAFGLESRMDNESRENLTKPMLKSHAEERYTELVKEITAKDKSLVDVLKPLPVRESAISLMKSLFSADISTRERSRNRELKNNKMNIESLSKSHSKPVLPKKSCSQKADGECLDDITVLKVELISSINSQLKELCGERECLLSEIGDNTNHGTNLEAVVKEVCKPNEYERYMMFIGDLEKVVSLLFCLSMRLARVENALSKADKNTDAEEMQSLKERHNLLSRQREDAKDLKDNLDRREQVVTGILAKYLSETQLEDYKHFVRLKTSFLIEQKDLDEKIKFHEEQLESLHSSIPP